MVDGVRFQTTLTLLFTYPSITHNIIHSETFHSAPELHLRRDQHVAQPPLPSFHLAVDK